MSTWQRWAIDTRENGLIGRGWWFGGKPSGEKWPYEVPTKLWLTRREAREMLPDVRRSFKRARVVPVSVEVVVREWPKK